jgi:hypothetical protein
MQRYGASARADHGGTGDTGDVDDEERHVAAAAIWATLELGISALYYWRTQQQQEVDWTRPSWTDKLSLHAVRRHQSVSRQRDSPSAHRDRRLLDRAQS